MIALIAAVFVASVLGSLHCAGMCGAFLAFAVGSEADRPFGRPGLHVAYHGGRLFSYTLLGALAGGLGALVDLAGVLAGVQPIAMMLAAVVVIGFGVIALLRLSGVKLTRFSPPPRLQKLVNAGHAMAMAWRPTPRAWTIGLLTTLLPCGWLYAFVFTAAGTADPLWGAATMFAFWAGTLPVMVSLGVGLRGLLGTFGKRVPIATCILLIVVGLYTLFGRSHLEPLAMAQSIEAANVENDSDSPVVPDTSHPPGCLLHEHAGSE